MELQKEGTEEKPEEQSQPQPTTEATSNSLALTQDKKDTSKNI